MRYVAQFTRKLHLAMRLLQIFGLLKLVNQESTPKFD
jgi:hypothetical protein